MSLAEIGSITYFFASVLFDFALRERLVNKTDAKIQIHNTAYLRQLHSLQTHSCNENRVFPVQFFSQGKTCFHPLVSSIFQIVHFLFHPNFDLVSSLLVIFAATKVVEMTTGMIECYHLRQHFTVLQKRQEQKLHFYFD